MLCRRDSSRSRSETKSAFVSCCFGFGGAQYDDGLVIEVSGAGLEVGDRLKDSVYRELSRRLVLGLEKLSESLVAKHIAGGVDGVDDAVGEEDDEVAGAGG